MTFSSYLTNLIIPFNLCMTLVVIGLVLGLFRRKTGGALIVAGLLWALAWSLPVTSVWLGGALESRYPHLSLAIPDRRRDRGAGRQHGQRPRQLVPAL